MDNPKFWFTIDDQVIMDSPEGYKPCTGEEFEGTWAPEVTVYCRTLPTVYWKIWLAKWYLKDGNFTATLSSKSFKFRGKNYLWIYWINFYPAYGRI